MNMITSRRAISVFPLTTFVRREYVRSTQQDAYLSSMERIAGVLRGVEDCSDMAGREVVPLEMDGDRRVGDGKCWNIPCTVCDGLPYGMCYLSHIVIRLLRTYCRQNTLILKVQPFESSSGVSLRVENLMRLSDLHGRRLS